MACIGPKAYRSGAARCELDRLVAAYHEAGHAVAAIAVRRSLTRVSIATGPGYGGTTSLTTLTAQRTHDLEKDIVIALAGTFAERRHRGGVHDRMGSSHDFEQARTLAKEVAVRSGDESPQSIKAVLQRAFDRAEKIVTDEWESIHKLAELLIRRETVSGRRARRIVAGTRTS